MALDLWIAGLWAAGVAHLVTLISACCTPIPPNWEATWASMPDIHRRFAVAQNFSIGAMIAILGAFSIGFAPELTQGTPLARAICALTALFWLPAATSGGGPLLGSRRGV